jgi:hypothetical protein
MNDKTPNELTDKELLWAIHTSHHDDYWGTALRDELARRREIRRDRHLLWSTIAAALSAMASAVAAFFAVVH